MQYARHQLMERSMRQFFSDIRPHLPRALFEAAVMSAFLLALAIWLPVIAG